MPKLPHLISILFAASVIAVFLSACADEESYTQDTGALLQFEQDTLRFDTVFSSIGSSTKRMRIYNRNKKGIHLQTVRLASGGESGFRINVDGHSGTVISDVDVLGSDSIFLFAEVTVNPHDSDTPVLVRDSVLFYLESGVCQTLLLEAHGQDVVILRGTVFSTETLLSASRPYLIYDSLVVGAGATLRVGEGTTLCFHNGAYLGVHGRLLCEGSLGKEIVMRGDRTDNIFSYLPYDRMDGQWGGVTLYPESWGNELEYVDIHGGNWGVDCPLSSVDSMKVRMTNTTIGNVRNNALRLVATRGEFANCLFWNAGDYCVNIVGGNHAFVHCTLAQCYPWDSGYGGALYFANCVGDTIFPLERASFANSVLTGRIADAIVGAPSEDSDAAFSAQFDHCLVNIDLPEDTPDYIAAMFASSVNEHGLFPSSESSSTEEDTTKVYGVKNFRKIDDEVYSYDFHLDSLSNARHVGSGDYVGDCPTDLAGKRRDTSAPDAGCYEY